MGNVLNGSILECDWKKILPYGDCVAIIKDDDEARSAGGILIPGQHQEYKRRGWVLAVGGGCRVDGGKRVVLPPYEPGDYIFCDRPFVRQDEREDEIFVNPTILLVPFHTRDDGPIAYVKAADCVGSYKRYALPEKYREIVKKFGYKPQL